MIPAVCALAAAIAIALTAGSPLDYDNPACSLSRQCDDPAPAINALAHGHFDAFAKKQTLMGPVSEVAAAPFVAVAGDGRIARYRAALLPSLIAVALLGAVLAAIAASRGSPQWFQLLIAVGAVVNPVTFWVLDFGHPEELLGGALVAGAGIAAWRGRAGWAGLLVGLALANKLWAVLALPVLVLALRPEWRRFAAVALITGGLLLAGPALAAPSNFRANLSALGKLGSAPGTVSITSAWFQASSPVVFDSPLRPGPNGTIVMQRVAGFELPRAVAQLAKALILLAALGLALAWARRAEPRGSPEILLVLGLVLMLRCVLDPGTRSYYHAPFLLAVLAYEALVRDRIPGLAIAGAAGVEFVSLAAKHVHSEDLLNAAYLVWSVPMSLAMVLELFGYPRLWIGARAPANRAA